MSEPRTYPDEPFWVPLPEGPDDPAPVPGCAGCDALANVRQLARRSGDFTTVTDANVMIRRHPHEQ
ncbi:hypothetical protein ACWF95_25375 [Streptomyces vinaceus]